MQFRNFLNFVLSALVVGSVLAIIPFAFQAFAIFSVCIVGVNLAEWIMTMTRKHFMYKKVSPANKAVLITGCDSGFGNMLAKRLDKLGYRVFAACLDSTGDGAKELANACSNNLTVVDMDVTNDKSIQVAKDFVQEKLGSNILWAVVNNAGIGQVGEIDWTPFEELQKVYDVNAAGMLRVIKTFLPFLKKSRGRIVNVTSNSGRFTCPGFVGYSMSKSAAIALTTGLRIELAKWKVKAISIEPFFYKTPLTTSNNAWDIAERTWNKAPSEIRKQYGEHYKRNFKVVIEDLLNRKCNLNVNEVIDCIEDAITAQDPLAIYSPCGLLDKFLINFALTLPNVIADNALRFELERFVKPAAVIRKTQ